MGSDFAFDGALLIGDDLPEPVDYDMLGKQIELHARDPRVKKLYDFYGCYRHACEICYPDYNKAFITPDPSKDKGTDSEIFRQAESINIYAGLEPGKKSAKAANKFTAEVLHNNILRRRKFAKAIGVDYEVIWEHDYDKQIKQLSKEDKKKYNEEHRIIKMARDLGCLNHRKGMHGGRTEVFGLHYKCKPDEVIKYLDVSGLYPHVLMQAAYAIDHPVDLSEQEIAILGSRDRDRQLALLNTFYDMMSNANDTQEGTYDLFLRRSTSSQSTDSCPTIKD